MSRSVKKWTSVIAVDLATAALVYAWMAHDIEGAWRALVWAGWFFGCMAVLGGFFLNKTECPEFPKFMYSWHAVTDAALVILFAWHGHPILASVYAFGHAAMVSARQREPKEAA